MNEGRRLATIVDRGGYLLGPAPQLLAHACAVAGEWFQSDDVLELGPAEGLMTDLLVEAGYEVTVVEAAEPYCRQIAERHPTVSVVRSLFEEYSPATRFGSMLLGHVLEHVADPAAVLQRAREWLRPNARVFAAVPNALSLHRQIGTMLGMIDSPYSLNEGDVRIGHRRVFDPDQLGRLFADTGYRVLKFGGYYLKSISDGQITREWGPELIDAHIRLGENYPEIAADIYVVAEPE